VFYQWDVTGELRDNWREQHAVGMRCVLWILMDYLVIPYLQSFGGKECVEDL
jgi:hypothetical protein